MDGHELSLSSYLHAVIIADRVCGEAVTNNSNLPKSSISDHQIEEANMTKYRNMQDLPCFRGLSGSSIPDNVEAAQGFSIGNQR